MRLKILVKIENFVTKKLIPVIEIALTIIIGIAVLSSIPSIVIDIYRSIDFSTPFDYDYFTEFLKHILSLVVGIELIAMILSHSPESMLTLSLFVIARKMLVYAQNMIDLLIGVVAIAVVFVIMKFLTNDEKTLARFDDTFFASILVEKLNREYDFDLPLDFGNTLGGFVYTLAQEKGIELKKDIVLQDEKYSYKIIEIYGDTVIRVQIKKL